MPARAARRPIKPAQKVIACFDLTDGRQIGFSVSTRLCRDDRRRTSPPNAGFSSDLRKSLSLRNIWWWTQSNSNQSLPRNFPAYREINREAQKNGPLLAPPRLKTIQNFNQFSGIPYSNEQGILSMLAMNSSDVESLIDSESQAISCGRTDLRLAEGTVRSR
jgi:hypothetical protein